MKFFKKKHSSKNKMRVIEEHSCDLDYDCDDSILEIEITQLLSNSKIQYRESKLCTQCLKNRVENQLIDNLLESKSIIWNRG